MRVKLLGAAFAALLAAPGTMGQEVVRPDKNPFPSTYAPLPSTATLIINATVLDGRGGRIENGAVLMRNGNVVAVGANIANPGDVAVIDAHGKWVTPGVIDTHSHLGVYASPGVQAHSDGNELTSPTTAKVWAEHAVWPHDPGFHRARAGGVTSMHILPGSGNLFGGRGVTLKNVPSRSMQGMKFLDAPYTLKMACGENPKRVYGGRGRLPGSRMGNFAGYRQAWIGGAAYRDSWNDYWEKAEGDGDDAASAKAPKRNLENETLMGVLEGEILIQMHCYRADEMVQVIDMAKEFGYKVTSFHHAVESYKIADILRENDICSSMWSDWWGFKMEAYDGIRENIPFVHNAGACAIVHSDSAIGIQRLQQAAAKALGHAARAGIEISKADAWQWISYNPAKAIGISDTTGSLEAGKDADVVIWSGDPFSVYTQAEKVFVDGALLYDRDNPDANAVSDFELGHPGEGDAK